MRVLLACEESQVVCEAFRAKGHEAYSCDIQDCSGDHPEWHIKGSVLNLLDLEWDLMIAFPPCTYLTAAAAQYWEKHQKNGNQARAVDLFLKLFRAKIDKIAVENPVGIMNTIFRKPDQIIHPYYFGDEFQKKTCLWLKNLPPLYHNAQPNLFDPDSTHVGKGEMKEYKSTKRKRIVPVWYSNVPKNKVERSKIRSKTFPGIAKAMAEQWG